MSTLTVDLPRSLTPERARLLLAVHLFEEGEVSLGYAAEMAGTSVRSFIQLLGERGVSVVDYPEEELDQELDVLSGFDTSD